MSSAFLRPGKGGWGDKMFTRINYLQSVELKLGIIMCLIVMGLFLLVRRLCILLVETGVCQNLSELWIRGRSSITCRFMVRGDTLLAGRHPIFTFAECLFTVMFVYYLFASVASHSLHHLFCCKWLGFHMVPDTCCKLARCFFLSSSFQMCKLQFVTNVFAGRSLHSVVPE